MLYFVGTRFHRYTLDNLHETRCGGHDVWAIPVSYDDLFAADLLPAGTYLFTDIERLSSHERLLAAAVFRAMAAHPATFRPINDPARVRVRYGLLRALFHAGLNRFDAYRASGLPRPRRFPVFIRPDSTHDPALTDLIHDQAALDISLAALEAAGQPLDGLIVIEFAGQAVRPGLWARHAAFRIGDEILPSVRLWGAHWMVKREQVGLADGAMYQADDAQIRLPADAALRTAFDTARIEYGRIDFGLLDGVPQIWEINTNPNIEGLEPSHPSGVRRRSRAFVFRRQTECLAALARSRPSGEAVALNVPLLDEYRQRGGGAPMGWRP